MHPAGLLIATRSTRLKDSAISLDYAVAHNDMMTGSPILCGHGQRVLRT